MPLQLAKLDKWIQSRPAIVAVWAVFIAVAAYGSIFAFWRELLTFVPWYWPVGGLIVVLLFLDFRHWRMGKVHAANSRVLNQLLPHIWNIVPSDYIVKNAELTYSIEKDGSCYCEREYTIAAQSQPVHWLRNRLGVVTGDEQKWKSINFVAKDERDRIMPYYLVRDELREKWVLTAFLPPLEPADPPRTVKQSYTWKGLWGPLIETGQDTGFYDASLSPTSHLTLTLVAPPQYTWDSFSVNPPSGITHPIEQRFGRSLVKWEIDNPSTEYRYLVRIRKQT